MDKINTLKNWMQSIRKMREYLQLNKKPQLTKEDLEKLRELKVDNFTNLGFTNKRKIILLLYELELAGRWLLSDLTKPSKESK